MGGLQEGQEEQRRDSSTMGLGQSSGREGEEEEQHWRVFTLGSKGDTLDHWIVSLWECVGSEWGRC